MTATAPPPAPLPAPPLVPPRAALRDTLGVGIGIFPLGLAFGVLLTQSGYAGGGPRSSRC
ncbi:hypothetical protein [Kitasatospora albolonga]|uniref:hypothetical protein n=1 Tax=Kitasatospora albolonga TaxID=68173 RepID=UPI0031F057B6